MLTIFCFLSVIKLTNLQAGYRKKKKLLSRAAEKLGTPETNSHVLYNPVVPDMQSQLRQWNNNICPGLSLFLQAQGPWEPLPYKSQPVREDELVWLQSARRIEDLTANQFCGAVHCKRHFWAIPRGKGKPGEQAHTNTQIKRATSPLHFVLCDT